MIKLCLLEYVNDFLLHLCPVCSILSSSVALIIDISWDPLWPELTNILRSANIPYIRVDVTIRPYTRAFLKFVEFTDTHDVALIFENEKGKWLTCSHVVHCLTCISPSVEQFEGIYEVLNQYQIRSITFNGLNEATADRIIKMRPMPSHFVIFAQPSEMTTLFQNVTTLYLFAYYIVFKRIESIIFKSIGSISGNQIQCNRALEPLEFVLFGFR